jgi:hypothetical protein
MARKRRNKKKVALEPVKTEPGPQLPIALPDLPGPGTTVEREARKRLRKADSDLRRLEQRKKKAIRARERKERALDRRIARIDRSKRRPTTSLVALIGALHGIAAAMVVLPLYWPQYELYDSYLFTSSPHWEVAAVCVAAAGFGGLALVWSSPSRDYLERARFTLSSYLKLVIIITIVGALVAHILEPMEGFGVDWPYVMLLLVIIAAGAGVPLPLLHFTSHWGGSRFHLSGTYHWVMGTLSVILVSTLVLLPIFFIAQRGWMFEIGLAMTVVGFLGMLFPVPSLLGTFVIGGTGSKGPTGSY